jgi:nucleoside-diphosphate-sugar epimerase
MRALVTGSSGFVGRHMAHELRRRGWTVDGIDLFPFHDGGLDWELPRNCGHDGTYVHTRIDCLELFAWAPDPRFDLVVHAAASSPHRVAIDGEPLHMARNLQLDAAMFNWAVRTGQRRVLYLSSSAAYPVGLQAGHTPYRLAEDDANPDNPVSADLLAALGHMGPLRPDARYGWTKLTGEQMAAAAAETGLPVHVVRPFSGYGADQAEEFPFRALIERARRREDPYVIWGDGRQVRDWIHISDVVAGALAVVDADERRPVNLCTGVGTSMSELAALACEQVGYRPRFEFLADKPAGVAYRVGDPHRFRQLYTPRVELTDGVRHAMTGGSP